MNRRDAFKNMLTGAAALTMGTVAVPAKAESMPDLLEKTTGYDWNPEIHFLSRFDENKSPNYEIKHHYKLLNIDEQKIRELPEMIKFFKNSPEAWQLIAIEKSHLAVDWIANMSKDIQLAYVKKWPEEIGRLNDPCEEAQMYVVGENPYLIHCIKEPTPAVQLLAATNDYRILRFIKSPTREAQKAALEQDCYAINLINDPDEELQLLAVCKNPAMINCIQNPTEKVKEYCAFGVKNPEFKIECLTSAKWTLKALTGWDGEFFEKIRKFVCKKKQKDVDFYKFCFVKIVENKFDYEPMTIEIIWNRIINVMKKPSPYVLSNEEYMRLAELCR